MPLQGLRSFVLQIVQDKNQYYIHLMFHFQYVIVK